MSIHYKKANCTLYRLPEINLGNLALYIDDQIVDGWRNNRDPNSLLASLISDTKVVGAIRQQIGNNVTFQRQQELERIAREEAAKVAQIAQATDVAVQTYEKEANQVIEQQRVATQRVVIERTTKEQEATAARQRLAELRHQVRSQIFELGGEEGYAALLEIDRQVREAATTNAQNYQTTPQQQGTAYTPNSTTPTTPGATTPIAPTAPVTVENLEQKLATVLDPPQKKPKKKGFWYKFIRIWVTFPDDEQ